MGLLGLLLMVVWGAVVGWIANKLYGLAYPNKESLSFLGTSLVGIAGSFLGGFVSFLLGHSRHMLHPSGWFLSIIGAVLVCFVWAHKSDIQAWFSSKFNNGQ